MHELSLATEIARIAADHLSAAARDAGADVRLLRVGIEVGRASGVELENLSFCLTALLLDAPFNGAELDVRALDGDVLRVAYVEVEDGLPA